MNTQPSAVEMSVLLLTPDTFDTIRKTVRHLQAQTVRHRLELVIIAPARAHLQLDETAVAGFGAIRVVEVGRIQSTAGAKAAALTQLTTTYAAFAEDHCFPAPNWAETLLAAHAAGHAIVGPVIDNANPATALSWANFIACFNRWTGPLPTGEIEETPYHNTSFRRDLLLAFGPALADRLVNEHFIQQHLRAQGHRPFLVADTRARHVNFSKVRPWFRHAFLGGRLYGGMRWHWGRWPAWKRVVYFCGSPLVPFLRLARTISSMRRDPRQWERWPGVLPWLFLGFIQHTLGEMLGYLRGVGNAEPRYARLESHRLDNITAHDRAQLADP